MERLGVTARVAAITDRPGFAAQAIHARAAQAIYDECRGHHQERNEPIRTGR
ncbi:hypothetical protein D3C72_533290 [compost metagenome]